MTQSPLSLPEVQMALVAYQLQAQVEKLLAEMAPKRYRPWEWI
jgi:hypothetical protein